MKKNAKKRGFTLVELIVVIAILGILAAIAIPKFTGVQEKSKLQAHLTNIRTIESAIATMEAENNTLTGINNTTLTGKYINVWPTKPGTYTVTDGVLVASPTKTATENALNGGTAVTWP